MFIYLFIYLFIYYSFILALGLVTHPAQSREIPLSLIRWSFTKLVCLG